MLFYLRDKFTLHYHYYLIAERVLSEPVQNFFKKKLKKKPVREDAKNRGVETTRLKF